MQDRIGTVCRDCNERNHVRFCTGSIWQATDAVQLFGAAGISNEFPINRYFRDAKVLQIIEGTNQIQRNIIARSLLGARANA